MKTPTPIQIQGRLLTDGDIVAVRELREHNQSWSRSRLSRELAERWNWRNGAGQLKDIACRSLLRKLADRGMIDLPASRMLSPNCFRQLPFKPVDHDSSPIAEALSALQPLQLLDITSPMCSALCAWLLARYHYLSFKQPVGENMTYLVADRHGRPLACLLFGSAAWTCAARDQYIGWDVSQRRQHLQLLTNNHRFLILPWVNVPCLASHLLSIISKRLSQDWQAKYGHPILLLETFVEQRFQGTCYRAANWRRLGETTGRTRNGSALPTAPIKDVYLYPLHEQAIERLCHDH